MKIQRIFSYIQLSTSMYDDFIVRLNYVILFVIGGNRELLIYNVCQLQSVVGMTIFIFLIVYLLHFKKRRKFSVFYCIMNVLPQSCKANITTLFELHKSSCSTTIEYNKNENVFVQRFNIFIIFIFHIVYIPQHFGKDL